MDETKEVKTEAKTPELMLREIETNVEKRVEEKIESSLVEKIDAKFRAALADLKPKIEVVGPASEYRAIAQAMMEKRAITLNGSGAYKVVQDLVQAVINKIDLLSKYRFEYGAGAQMNIPVLSARPARPTKQAEGATSITADSTASLGVMTLTPYAYVSDVPISAEALIQGAADIESKLPQVFGDSFAEAMFYGSIVGDGTMTGIFNDTALSNDITCAAIGAPTWGDLIKFAGKVKGYAFNPLIIISPDIMSNLLADTSNGLDPLKTVYETRGTIRGVPVYESNFAPSTTTAGSIVAVAMDPANYAIGVASALNIIPIRKPGDTNTYFQAEAFFNGKPILAANGWQLKTV